MKKGILGIIAAAMIVAVGNSHAAEEKFREYRSNAGASISAKLLHHKGDGSVTMELATGKESTIPILRFSDEDQKFLTEWVKVNPPKIKYTFNYEIATERDTIKRSTGYYDSSKSGKHSYSMKITNMSRDTATDLTVKYQMFMENNTSGSGYSYEEGDGYMLTDEVKFDADMAYNHSREFTTKAFKIDEERYRYYASRSNRKDVMEGIIIRIYDKAGTMVDEWKSQPAERAKHEWVDPNKKKERTSSAPAEEPAIRID